MGLPEGRVRYIAGMQAALEVQKTNLLLSTAPILILATQIGWIQSNQSNLFKLMVTVSVTMLLIAAFISLIFVFSGSDYIAKINLESDGIDADSSPYLSFIKEQYEPFGGLSDTFMVGLGPFGGINIRHNLDAPRRVSGALTFAAEASRPVSFPRAARPG